MITAATTLGLASTPCVEMPHWRGALGTCEHLEQLGFCYDGSTHPVDKTAASPWLGGAPWNVTTARVAARACCACGRHGARERCPGAEVSVDMHKGGFNAADEAARLRATTLTFQSRANLLRAARVNPKGCSLDWLGSKEFAQLSAHLRILEHILQTFYALLRRLTLLGLCSRVCDANVFAVDTLRIALPQLIGSSSATDAIHSHFLEATLAARAACHRNPGESISGLVQVLSEVCLGMRQIADLATANMMNRLFVARGGSSVAVYPDVVREPFHWHGKRWDVIRTLLQREGCETRNCTAVEVGVFAAETSVHLLSRLPLLRLHGVDPYGAFDDQPGADETIFELASRLYKGFGDRATLHRSVSREVAPHLDHVDFVFIDGSHLYEAVAEDIAVWAPKARRLAGHDFNLANGGVMRAVQEWAAGRHVYLLPDAVWLADP
eukprot:TRINITY_DN17018_c0_g1_i1.p1 TRINITY_DN17018_c0_g1~~TRINITY_DN17018_c0_g1_i1.p1  ORF type:complete len:439 (+),score=52.94 TRINITY_DN17018_c0_g1_i1:87-1403(+)